MQEYLSMDYSARLPGLHVLWISETLFCGLYGPGLHEYFSIDYAFSEYFLLAYRYGPYRLLLSRLQYHTAVDYHAIIVIRGRIC